MSRTKIAPRLQACVRAMPDWEREGLAGRELAALIAVARAAERALVLLRAAKWETIDLGLDAMETRGELDRALARLRRVSGGDVKGNRKLPANSRRASPGGAEGGGRHG